MESLKLLSPDKVHLLHKLEQYLFVFADL